MRLGICTNCLCFFLRFSSTCFCTLYNFASLSFLSMWAICISVHLLYVFSFPLLTALWRDKRWPKLLLKSGCRCVWGKPKSLDVKEERLMKTVWKEGEPILVMPAWTLLKISLQQRERDPSLTWHELGKETSRSRQLATRKAFSTFRGQQEGREAASTWRGLARGTSPTCGPWWGKPIQREYKERTGRILRELGREALFTWRDQEREILIQRQRRTWTKLSIRASKRSDFDLALGWTSLYCFKGGISKWAFYQRQPEKKSRRLACLVHLSNLSFLFSIFEYFPICKSSFFISCISWAYD